MMFARAREWPDKPMLRALARRRAGSGITWGEFARQAASVARRLRAAGVAAGDRVVIVAENRPEYPIAETALMAIRAVPVPAYVTNTVDDHAHILRDSGARGRWCRPPRWPGGWRPAGPLDLLVVMEAFVRPGAHGGALGRADRRHRAAGRHRRRGGRRSRPTRWRA